MKLYENYVKLYENCMKLYEMSMKYVINGIVFLKC